MQIKELYTRFLDACSGVSIDTRTLQPKDLFFALEGEQVDGHQYITTALDRGAGLILARKGKAPVSDARIVEVEDVLKTLQDLARTHRRTFHGKVIGLTGSNGKTTTKELLREVLSTRYTVQATEGNFNNHIGVPLTLLRMDPAIDFAIVEMGANHQKEIGHLAQIAEPDLGLITNYGKAHLEGFGGVEGIIKGKSELYDFLSSRTGAEVFYNLNDPIQEEKSKKIKIRFGYSLDGGEIVSDLLHLKGVLKDGFLRVSWEGNQAEKHQAETQLQGAYNLSNVAYALLAGKRFNVPEDLMIRAIREYSPNMNRSQWVETQRNHLIVDCYNANPDSTRAAVHHLKNLDRPRKIAVLGDMLELGEYAEYEHRQILDQTLQANFSSAVFVGPLYGALQSEYPMFHFFNGVDQAIDWIKNAPIKDATLLLKGSRGIQLERLIEHL